MEKVASIINEYTDDLGTFFTEHPQGKHIPVYLTEVSKCMQDEQTDIMSRLQVLADNVQHIKDIISMQQSYAKVTGFEVQTSLGKLAEDAIQINSAGLERHEVQLIREFEELGDVETEFIHIADYEISPCKACDRCIKEYDRKLFCPTNNDDMEKLLPKLLEADGVIFASPTYVYHSTALMKKLIERTGFFGHRPVFFDKYAMVLGTCKGFGAKEVTKYMKGILLNIQSPKTNQIKKKE